MQNIVLFKHMLYSYLMKNALKNWKVWMFTGILSVVGIGLSFAIFFITDAIPDATAVQYPILLGLFAAVYLLVGFVWGDLYVANYRRKNKNWDDQIPEEIKTNAWIRHWPFYLASATVFLVFISFEILYWVGVGYPFIS